MFMEVLYHWNVLNFKNILWNRNAQFNFSQINICSCINWNIINIKENIDSEINKTRYEYSIMYNELSVAMCKKSINIHPHCP